MTAHEQSYQRGICGGSFDCEPLHKTNLRPPLPRMKRVCAWCKDDLGFVECEPANDGKITHAICPSCYKKQFTEIA